MANEFDSTPPESERELTSVSDSNITPSMPDEDTPELRDPFEELASEFSERHRRGEMPSVEEYARKYPEHEEEIRDLFPTIAAMEQLKERKAPAKPAQGGLQLEQLGDFRILGEIGRGGMGVVYEAEQVSLGRHVAVKVLPKQALLDERHLRRFEREAQTAAKLHHTNIVPVFGVGQQDGFHYIVMQFIPGVGLDEILIALRTMVLDDDSTRFRIDSSSRASHANHNAKALLDGNFSKHSSLASSFVKDTRPNQNRTQPIGSMEATQEIPSGEISVSTASSTNPSSGSDQHDGAKPLDADNSRLLGKMDSEYYQSVARIGQQVADALAYAHEQGTLHRDIKPGNLLLDATGTVWVADFGLAKLAEQDNVSRTGDIVGTLSYMPPESFSGETDARGDIYALGLTLYEMLAMRPAYYGRDRGKLVRQITEGDLPRLGKLNPGIPRDLETIVLKAIAHRPEDRYATARDLEEDLQNFMHDMPIQARRMSTAEQFTRWCRKNKLVASLSAAAFLLLAFSLVTLGVLNYRTVQHSNVVTEERDKARREKDRADQQTVVAKEAEENARQTAMLAISALTNMFNGFVPDRLPATADQSLQTDTNDALTAGAISVGEIDADESSDESTVATVAVAPAPTPETAARLEVLLKSFSTLTKQANIDREFAPIFADLTVRVGKLHRMLGNFDDAQTYFADGIEKYEAIVDENSDISTIIGLASAYNEQGDVIALTRHPLAAYSTYQQALDLFATHEEKLGDSPRATYERARTLFLMSMEYKPGPGQMGGGRRQGNGPPGFARGRGGRGGGPPPEFAEGGRGRPPGGRGGPEGGRGDGPRRPEQPGRGNGFFRDRVPRLQTAISLLTPIAKSESNPEYRNLLARCHAGLAIHRGGELSRNDRQKNLRVAIQLLEVLIQEQPEVADYKFEYAIARLFSTVIEDYGSEQKLEIVRNICDLTSEISTSNPAVSHYAFLNARAQMAHSEAASRFADRVQRNGEGDLVSLRTEARDALDSAVTAAEDVVRRFSKGMDSFLDQFPSQDELDFRRLVVGAELDQAQAAALRAEGKVDEANALLTTTKARVREQVIKDVRDVTKREINFRRPPERSSRLSDSARLICMLEKEIAGEEKARTLAQQIKAQRIIELKKGRGDELSQFELWEVELQFARILRAIGDDELAIATLENLRTTLSDTWYQTPDGTVSLSNIRDRFMTGRLLEETLRELRDDEGMEKFRDNIRQVFERFRGRPGGGGGFNGPRGPRGSWEGRGPGRDPDEPGGRRRGPSRNPNGDFGGQGPPPAGPDGIPPRGPNERPGDGPGQVERPQRPQRPE